jgi:integrase
MPRRQRPARLWLRPARKAGKGKPHRSAVWIILDRGRQISTGCIEGQDSAAAQAALAEYIQNQYQPSRKERDIESIAIADVLSIYEEDKGRFQANQAKFYERLGRLNEFWGSLKLSEVTGVTCRDYARSRGSYGGARRDLEDLRAAINHHANQGFHRNIVRVVLPRKGLPRDRWLTRQEAARLLLVCWRHRELQVRHRGPEKGQKIATAKYPLRHLARFILIGLYTGTRAAAVASASSNAGAGRSFVDLENGIFYRLARGKRETNKRQPPVPIPQRLLAHLRRWDTKGISREHFVEWNGKPVKSVKTAFKSAAMHAGLKGVSPHTLRHTAATWLMQLGVSEWQASGFLGMSPETLRRVYGHHHPAYLGEAAGALSSRKPQSLVVSLAAERKRRTTTTKTIETIGGPGSNHMGEVFASIFGILKGC